MSGLPGISTANSSSPSNKRQVSNMLKGILYSSRQEQSSSAQAGDPETASVASFSSTSALLKGKGKDTKPAPTVDHKKLQDQALKSQFPAAWSPATPSRF